MLDNIRGIIVDDKGNATSSPGFAPPQAQEAAARDSLPCPKCRTPQLLHQSDTRYDFFFCPACRGTFALVDGMVKREKTPHADYRCGLCNAPLARYTGLSPVHGKTLDFYACSNPHCDQRYASDPDGTPQYGVLQGRPEG